MCTASYDKTCIVWDSTHGVLRYKLGGHGRELTCVAFSRDLHRVAGVLKKTTEEELQEVAHKGHHRDVTSCAFATPSLLLFRSRPRASFLRAAGIPWTGCSS